MVGLRWWCVALLAGCGPDVPIPWSEAALAVVRDGSVSLVDVRGREVRRVRTDVGVVEDVAGWAIDPSVLLVEALPDGSYRGRELVAIEESGTTTHFAMDWNGDVEDLQLVGATESKLLVRADLYYSYGYWGYGSRLDIVDLDAPDELPLRRAWTAGVRASWNASRANAVVMTADYPPWDMPEAMDVERTSFVVALPDGDVSWLPEHDPTGGDEMPSWSPDGTRMVFAGSDGQLYLMRADGRGRTPITSTVEPERDAVWSPRGDLIAFLRGTDDVLRLGVIAPDGSNEAEVGSDAGFGAPTWSPDGEQLAFQRRDGSLHVVDVSGFERAITSDAVGVFAWSPDARHLAFVLDLPAVVIVELETGEQARIDRAMRFAWRQ
jgi:hypothetical protein